MRYHGTKFYLRRTPQYDILLKKRNIREATEFYSTTILGDPNLFNPAVLEITTESWGFHTKMFRLAHKYYGDSQYYWVIGLFNQKPTDAHWSIGDTIYIPTPLEYVVELLGF